MAFQGGTLSILTFVALDNIIISAAWFRRFVSMMIQSRHSVKCKLSECTIEPEENLTQLQVVMENQAALQRMDPRPVSTDYTIGIELHCVTMSAAVLGRLVTMMLQSRHSVKFKLWECTVEPEENVKQPQIEIENQATHQRMNPQPVSTDYTIDIELHCVTMSAAAFRLFVSLVIQSRHSVKCKLSECTIKPEEDVTELQVDMGNQVALQRMDPEPVTTEFTIYIELWRMTMSVAVLRRFVSWVIQSEHNVKCKFWACTIEPKKGVRNLIVEMESQAALTVTRFEEHSSNKWLISFHVNLKGSDTETTKAKMTRFQKIGRFFGFMKSK